MTDHENPFDEISIDAVKYTAFIPMSNELLEDAALWRRWERSMRRVRVRRLRWSERREYWAHAFD